MSAYFVAGTGTGVGKTFATCALLHAARGRGVAVRGYKPVISGWADGTASDTAQIIAAGGAMQTVDDVSPWRFSAPLSPHRAAALEQRTLDVDGLIDWTNARCQMPDAGAPLMLFETVGGVMVPLSDTVTSLDWMKAVGLPVILVAGSYLGAISHTLTAMHALRSAGLRISAMILNETAGSSVSLVEAEAGLLPFIRDIDLRATQPLVSSWQEATVIAALGEHL